MVGGSLSCVLPLLVHALADLTAGVMGVITFSGLRHVLSLSLRQISSYWRRIRCANGQTPGGAMVRRGSQIRSSMVLWTAFADALAPCCRRGPAIPGALSPLPLCPTNRARVEER